MVRDSSSPPRSTGALNVYATVDDDRQFYGKVIFRVVGACALLLFLFWNPLVLRPRFWNASVLARSMAIDTALIVEAAHVWLSLMLLTTALILAVLIVVFWRTLAWGNRVLDPLFPLGSVVVCALINYIAFIAKGA